MLNNLAVGSRLVTQAREVQIELADGVEGVAELLAHTAGGFLLDAAVAEENVTRVLVEIRGPASNSVSGGALGGVEGVDVVVVTLRVHIQLRDGAVGEIAVAAQDALGLFFARRQAKEVAACAGKARSLVLGLVRGVAPSIGSEGRLLIAGALNDLRGAQFVRDAREDKRHGVRGAGTDASGRASRDGNTTLIDADLPRIEAVVVNSESTEAEADVLQVVNTIDTLGAGLGLSQCRQQHTCENRDDRDDD